VVVDEYHYRHCTILVLSFGEPTLAPIRPAHLSTPSAATAFLAVHIGVIHQLDIAFGADKTVQDHSAKLVGVIVVLLFGVFRKSDANAIQCHSNHHHQVVLVATTGKRDDIGDSDNGLPVLLIPQKSMQDTLSGL